ncbi:YceI family protein [Actinopolymorpha singaporensis]|uniref:Polyisoprenoid-binding protein YceI n=1 Tax=Actinopolymorpha singaporensis TaxID=117157 RepID=A0A1H1WJV2_9ACTN|nr:YceI family protein [Actinopolymorpha singaporensis]SDS96469.1 Polyisoprenoid-binding protein YceI [Actinopolymorpha singaporensis]
MRTQPEDRSVLTADLRTPDGWPVPHGVVTVTDLRGQQVARAEADDEGAVVTRPLPTGTYTAIVTAPGHTPAARTVVVGGSGATLGVVTLPRAGGMPLPAEGPWVIDPDHSSVEATARHLGFSSVKGRFTRFGGRMYIARPIEESRVHAVITADSIETGNKMRDDHLRTADFLDVARYPTIEFRSERLSATGENRWTMDGGLTINAINRPVSLDLRYLGAGPDTFGGVRAGFWATTELKRDDFAISYNQLVRAGVAAVGATIRVELNIQAVQGEELPSF